MTETDLKAKNEIITRFLSVVAVTTISILFELADHFKVDRNETVRIFAKGLLEKTHENEEVTQE